MLRQLLACSLVLLFCGCSNTDVPELEPTPLVVNLRLQIANSSPKYLEKHFVSKIEKAVKKLPHVASTHGMALTNEAVVTIFYGGDVKFAEAEAYIYKLIPDLQLPIQAKKITVVELCGAELSKSNLMHIAKNQGLNHFLDEVVAVKADLASNLLPKEEFDAMFHNECDEVKREAPLYILEE